MQHGQVPDAGTHPAPDQRADSRADQRADQGADTQTHTAAAGLCHVAVEQLRFLLD